jgi:HK97 family phage prohead protease
MPAFKPHKTATVDKPWDGPLNKGRAKLGQDHNYYGKIFAWFDPNGDPTLKQTYKFVHHEVDAAGTPGAANVRGCSTGIGVLNGGMGGTTVPDADLKGIWNHLAAHMKDAGMEPPELKARVTERETRNLALAEMKVETREGQPPQITGYAAVFDQPSEVMMFFREIIRPGAFTKTIQGGDVRALWNHDTAAPLGRTKNGTLELKEDAQGLHIAITPPDTTWARDAMESIRRGDVDQMSFGFVCLRDNWIKDDNGFPLREVLEVELWEVSPVTFPAYPDTSVAVRSMKEAGLDDPPKEKEYQPTGYNSRRRDNEIEEVSV